MSGAKHDAGKLQWHLLRQGMPEALEAVIQVLEFGAKKYAADSWQDVPNGVQRYRDALDRHLSEQDKGITHDDDSGLPHAYHVACNALFLAWFEHQRIKAKEVKADEYKNPRITHNGFGVPYQLEGKPQTTVRVFTREGRVFEYPHKDLEWDWATVPFKQQITSWEYV